MQSLHWFRRGDRGFPHLRVFPIVPTLAELLRLKNLNGNSRGTVARCLHIA